MCGICGLASPTADLVDPRQAIGGMLSAIWHRGPDAQGAHVQPRVALGSQRLAIIDLKSGDQPIYNEDRSLALVYNGEVYNHPGLQERLLAAGHHLASRTDSEVIVHLYEELGDELVHELDGMFAFALWDEPRQRLLIARDRFGVKPLHYTWDGTTLRFGSEIKSLLSNGLKAQLDLDAALELLRFQNVLSERSLFAGVKLLPPGSRLILDADGMRIEQWWSPLPDPGAHDERRLPDEIRERFDSGTRAQLISDVPVAAYLSGGLDTGAIAAVAARELDRLTTFSTGFDTTGATGMEAGFDEREDARGLSKLLGTHHHELLLGPQDMDLTLPRLIRALEEPRMSFSYPNYLTAGMASRWVKVVLSGAGGDELFGGYPWRYEIAGRDDFRDAFFASWQRLLADDALESVLTPGTLAALDPERPRRVFDEILEPVSDLPDLDQILFFEKRTFLHGLLVLEDKLSMAHSLESRVPFLANDLVDFVLTIPAETLLRGGRSKALFRDAMAPVLPEIVRERRKTGFTPPQAAWFRGAQLDYVERTLLSERSCDRGLLQVDFLRRAIEEHREGLRDRRLLLWTLLCLEWWHRIFVDGEHAT